MEDDKILAVSFLKISQKVFINSVQDFKHDGGVVDLSSVSMSLCVSLCVCVCLCVSLCVNV